MNHLTKNGVSTKTTGIKNYLRYRLFGLIITVKFEYLSTENDYTIDPTETYKHQSTNKAFPY